MTVPKIEIQKRPRKTTGYYGLLLITSFRKSADSLVLSRHWLQICYAPTGDNRAKYRVENHDNRVNGI